MNTPSAPQRMLEDYAPGATPGWTTTNNGHPVYENSRFGTLEVGVVPGKSWDQWLFHENKGGGSLVIGYYPQHGRLYVMMLRANRFNLAGNEDDFELPGGFTDEDDTTKLNTALRELLEETGQQVKDAQQVAGRLYVGNRAFFKLNSENEGTSVFAFELTDAHLNAIHATDELALMPWQDAIRNTRDALSGMAIARLVAELL
jgi:8-oxo-dGTP pyrophosphatase MutT (NUDIX family)